MYSSIVWMNIIIYQNKEKLRWLIHFKTISTTTFRWLTDSIISVIPYQVLLSFLSLMEQWKNRIHPILLTLIWSGHEGINCRHSLKQNGNTDTCWYLVGTLYTNQQTSSSGTHHRAMLKSCIQANPPLGTSLPYICLLRIPAWTYYQMTYTGYFSKGSKQAWILEKHKRLAIYFDYQSLASDGKKI